MPAVNKHFEAGARRAVIKLWRAKVPQRAIMKQLGMSKATLMRVLAFARANPADPIAKQKKGSGHPTKLTEATLEIMKTKLQKTPTLTAIQLRMQIPELEGISVRTIQRDGKQTLKMPSRMMRKKPLLTERMRIQRLEIVNAYRHWDEDDWKQVMFSDESQEHGGVEERDH
jgi:transposase